jgi:hypothetical protein
MLAAALLGAAQLCACAPAPITGDAPKAVVKHPLTPYAIHEECAELKPGDRLDYTFESTEPVDFNIHYHEGDAVAMPVVRERSRGDAGVFAPPLARHYCLMWEAGAAGALIDYRMRVRPAGP